MVGRIATGVVVVVLLLAATLYTVSENESVLRLRGAAIAEQGLAPGLHVRVPLLDRIVRIDAHGYVARATGVDVTSADGQAATVEVDIRWRVVDAAATSRLGADARAVDRRLEATSACDQGCVATRTLQEIVGRDAAAGERRRP
jgi:membrane protease subunit HflC